MFVVISQCHQKRINKQSAKDSFFVLLYHEVIFISQNAPMVTWCLLRLVINDDVYATMMSLEHESVHQWINASCWVCLLPLVLIINYYYLIFVS